MTDARPSKKQRELLEYIDAFIKENGYGPSYREVMRALDYKSVSTVAVHIDGLIARGFLAKRDHSARSLEVLRGDMAEQKPKSHLDWLKAELKKREKNEEEAAVLRAALDILSPTDKPLDQKGN